MNFYYPTLTNQIEQLPLFLTSVGIYFEETQISREDGFNDHQWIQTVSGEGEIFFDGTSHIIRPNEGMFIPAHVAHHYARITDQWITHWYSFNGRNTVNFLASIGFDSIRFIGLTDAGNHLQRIEDIYYMAISNFNANAFRISSLMYEQLEQVHSLFAAIDFDDQKGGDLHMNHAFAFIDKNYSRDFSIEELSAYVGISSQYLCRLFKKRLGLRPFEYISRVRINKSKLLLLQQPSIKIHTIAEAVGFNNPSYYTATFRKIEKLTPRQFMKMHQRQG